MMNKELEELFTIASQAISVGRLNGGDNETIARGRLRDIQRALGNYVVIPKGANCHPYADVLHEWIEDTTKQIEGSYPNSNFWKPISDFLQKEYRIKPSEPIFEYQFVYIKADNTAEITQFYTDEESKDCCQWIKLQETRRERKR